MYIIYKYHIADITKATQEEELNDQIIYKYISYF